MQVHRPITTQEGTNEKSLSTLLDGRCRAALRDLDNKCSLSTGRLGNALKTDSKLYKHVRNSNLVHWRLATKMCPLAGARVVEPGLQPCSLRSGSELLISLCCLQIDKSSTLRHEVAYDLYEALAKEVVFQDVINYEIFPMFCHVAISPLETAETLRLTKFGSPKIISVTLMRPVHKNGDKQWCTTKRMPRWPAMKHDDARSKLQADSMTRRVSLQATSRNLAVILQITCYKYCRAEKNPTRHLQE